MHLRFKIVTARFLDRSYFIYKEKKRKPDMKYYLAPITTPFSPLHLQIHNQ
jgi:hypothetical protein